jgi:hypothetical protein
MISLSDLEAKAKPIPEMPYHFVTPKQLLALIRVARAAQNAVNQGCLMHAAEGSIQLIEALKEIGE